MSFVNVSHMFLVTELLWRPLGTSAVGSPTQAVQNVVPAGNFLLSDSAAGGGDGSCGGG